MKAVEVEIMIGYLDIYFTFRDEMDTIPPLTGRQHRNHSLASRRRLARALSTLPCEVKIDGVTPYFTFKRKLPEKTP